MKIDSALTRMNFYQELMHEQDKKENPEHHYLSKDSYSKDEALEMCFRCADHYEWNKILVYNACTDRFYKNLEQV